MEFHSVVHGKKLPEVYHLSYDGTHLQIFLNPTYWFKFLDVAGRGTYYAKNQGQEYVPPSVFGGAFGQRECANAVKTPEGFMCLNIPAFLENSNNDDQGVSMHALGRTLASVLFILNHLLHEADKQNEEQWQGAVQLFVLETAVSPAGFDLSLSLLARKYLEGIGNNVRLDEAILAMEEHYLKPSKTKVGLFRTAIEVRLRTHGVLHMHTVGNCACLGAMPKDFGDRGCHLSSHNVDTVFQQFNLLVGVAYIWQMVRDGSRV